MMDKDPRHRNRNLRPLDKLIIAEIMRLISRREKMGGEFLRDFFVHDMRAEIKRNQYLTSDLVELIGGFDSTVKHLNINAAATIRLSRPEFVLFAILAAHGRSLLSLAGERFLSVETLLGAVDAWRDKEPRLGDFWETAIYINVHRTVSELRKKIEESGAQRNIIEKGPPDERGYRLSTSPYNVTIALL